VSDARVTALGNGRFLVTDGASRQLAYAAATDRQTWVFVDGRTFVIETDSPAREHTTASHRDDAGALSSPMPATVARVQVETGQDVRDGDVLIVLEAMKMELSITAPRDGRVKTIACHVGELVQPGIPLVELE
jgi:biotin carboxyl carrier protein